MNSLTHELAEFTVSGRAVDDAVKATCGRVLADTVGVAVAGTGGESQPILRSLDVAWGDVPPGSSLVLHTRKRSSVPYAALVNATAAHALDYDDVCHAVKGHPSTVLVPALLAQCEELSASGHELAHAYAVGVQVAAALWSAVGPRHYADGWHATATLGTVATAAAASRLLGASATQAAHAIGGAASFATGSQASFGTMVKPLHAGHAAQWGLLMARSAAAGMTANPQQLEHPLGLLGLFGAGREGVTTALERLHGEWVVTSEQGINVKKYPSCYFTHRAIDASMELRQEVDVHAIDRVEVTVSPGSMAVLNFGDVATGLQAKFNGCYLVATALLDGEVGLTAFEAPSLQRHDVTELARRVTWNESDVPPVGQAAWSAGYAVVTVTTEDGEARTHRVDIPRGDCRRPLSTEELWSKFSSCTQAANVDPKGSRALFDRLLNLPSAASAAAWSDGL